MKELELKFLEKKLMFHYEKWFNFDTNKKIFNKINYDDFIELLKLFNDYYKWKKQFSKNHYKIINEIVTNFYRLDESLEISKKNQTYVKNFLYGDFLSWCLNWILSDSFDYSYYFFIETIKWKK